MLAPAWASALARYREAWGDWPDFNNTSEMLSFMELLEAHVRAKMEADIAAFFTAAAAEIGAGK